MGDQLADMQISSFEQQKSLLAFRLAPVQKLAHP
jgi:hypothetical protein